MTDIYHDNSTTINCEVSLKEINEMFIFGSQSSGSKNANAFLTNSIFASGYPVWVYFFNQSISTNSYIFLSVNTKYNVMNGPNGAYVNNNKIYDYNYSGTYISDYPVAIFSLCSAGTIDNRTFKGKIYWLKVQKGESLFANLIPCYSTKYFIEAEKRYRNILNNSNNTNSLVDIMQNAINYMRENNI